MHKMILLHMFSALLCTTSETGSDTDLSARLLCSKWPCNGCSIWDHPTSLDCAGRRIGIPLAIKHGNKINKTSTLRSMWKSFVSCHGQRLDYRHTHTHRHMLVILGIFFRRFICSPWIFQKEESHCGTNDD